MLILALTLREVKPPPRAPIVVAALFAVAGTAATPPFADADGFIQKNCATCHNAYTPAARLDLTKLAYEPGNPDNFATWVKVHDRVSAGEMPPRAMPRPPADSVAQFVKGLSAALTAYERSVTTGRGRVDSGASTPTSMRMRSAIS